jgi:hypothetical protein
MQLISTFGFIGLVVSENDCWLMQQSSPTPDHDTHGFAQLFDFAVLRQIDPDLLYGLMVSVLLSRLEVKQHWAESICGWVTGEYNASGDLPSSAVWC